LPLNLKELWEDGVPPDTHIVNIRRSHRTLEFKRYMNGCYRVCVCDPRQDTKSVLGHSVSYEECCQLVVMAFRGKEGF